MIRPPSTRKAIATHLAEMLASPAGEVTLRHLKLLSGAGAAANGVTRPGASPVGDRSGPRTIGIWEPSVVDGVASLVRPAAPRENPLLWADVSAIGPKRPGRRVVLIGESAARGFLLDPGFTPAAALQAYLRALVGDDSVEVVDLARTDQLLEPMCQLVDAALDLRPDAFVILAGNNCRTGSYLRAGQLQDLVAILEQNGAWVDVRRYLESLIRDQIDDAIARVTHVARSAGIPCVWVLPEFNLLDWRTDADSPPLLSVPASAEWHQLREAARAALAADDPARAEDLAFRLMALDGESTPVGPNLIADARLASGAIDSARTFLERARDAAVCSPHPESPRCYAVVQETVRRAAARGACELVDLPRVFAQHWTDGLPDRRMFYDYCHLTVDGIRVGMAAVAQTLGRLWKAGDPHGNVDVARVPVPVDDRTVGEAHFLAAIHNANWGQSSELVRYHARRAAAVFPPVLRMMALFLEVHTRRTPSAVGLAVEELRERGSGSAVGRLLASFNPMRASFLNWKLIDALRDELRQQQPEAAAHVDRVVTREHAVDARQADLLQQSGDSYLQPFDQGLYGYYRAFTRRSRFRFVCETPRALTLIATLRCRHSRDGGAFSLAINGHGLFTATATTRWSHASVAIPADVLRSGVNTLDIDWPGTVWDLEAWKQSVGVHLLAGRSADVTPLCGEIHRLVIGACARHDPAGTDDAGDETGTQVAASALGAAICSDIERSAS